MPGTFEWGKAAENRVLTTRPTLIACVEEQNEKT